MKRINIIGLSIVAVFVLLMTPSISAVQYNTAVESNKAQILQQMQSMNIDELREKIKNLDFQELKEKLKNIGSNERIQLLLFQHLSFYHKLILVSYLTSRKSEKNKEGF